jgi:hypothetical protein
MVGASGKTSSSGVRIADDFRDNLIIDRYDPVFVGMRASKVKHLRSENSEDAVTWNVFRSLRQIDPGIWLPVLTRLALDTEHSLSTGDVSVSLWVPVVPPPGLLEEGDEHSSEIDVVIEGPVWAWFIEAKYRSDIATSTTTRPTRDQVLRNIDVGSYYAGVRDFYFSLLLRDETTSPVGAAAVAEYRNLSIPRRRLAGHRPDGLANLRAVSLMTWSILANVLRECEGSATRAGDRYFAERARAWLEEKGLG